jgi:hypothetical protein
MTITPAELGDEANVVARNHLPVAGPAGTLPETSTPVLITEQQVMLGSAIAISAPAPSQMNPFPALAVGVARVFTRSDSTPRQKYPPRTPGWYSDALMAREMWRL